MLIDLAEAERSGLFETARKFHESWAAIRASRRSS
jgi:hypothetical protein